MSAKINYDGSIEINTGSGSRIFERSFVSLAWPDESAGHMIVCGLEHDGRLVVFMEGAGGLFELGALVIAARSDYLIDSVVVDDRDRVSTMGLRNLDGLCFNDATSDATRKGPETRSSRRKLTLADLQDSVAVCPAPRDIIANYRGALERTRMLIMKRMMVIDEIQCPTLAHELFQSMNYVLASSAVRSLVLASGYVATADAARLADAVKRTPWYTNMRRYKAH